MALELELIDIIKGVYYEVLKKKYPYKSEEINVDYQKIAKEIRDVIAKENIKGSKILEIASAIIYMLLQKNFFKYENHEVAALITYVYLKRKGNTVGKFSIKNLSNNSTLEDIQKLTESWSQL